jgi:hypothetical protein
MPMLWVRVWRMRVAASASFCDAILSGVKEDGSEIHGECQAVEARCEVPFGARVQVHQLPDA